MKKKIIASFGVVGAVAIPVVSVVSCGASNDADNQDITKSISFMKNGMFVNSDEYTPIKEESSIGLKDFLKENRKIKKGEKIKVQDDIVVLADAYYTGKVQDISTIYNQVKPKAYPDMVARQTTSKFEYINGSAVIPRMKGGWGIHKPILEMGENDSLIYIFDDDDKDGRSLKEFKKGMVFEDTSIARVSKITEINKLLGLKKGEYSNDLVPFIGNLNKGVLSSYLGSQNNHPSKSAKPKPPETIEEIKERLGKIFPKTIANKIANYYKTASKAFAPTEIPFGFIKFEVIGPNAIKVDFSKGHNVTASHIGKYFQGGNKEWDAELSIGDQSEWDAYNKKEVSQKDDHYLIIGKH